MCDFQDFELYLVSIGSDLLRIWLVINKA